MKIFDRFVKVFIIVLFELPEPPTQRPARKANAEGPIVYHMLTFFLSGFFRRTSSSSGKSLPTGQLAKKNGAVTASNGSLSSTGRVS